MALHDRLRPTEIPPVATRPSHGLLLVVTLIVLAAGFAYAMPRAMQISAEEPLTEEVAVVETTPTPSESPTVEVVVTDEDETETETEEEATEENKADNHGSAVSTAAHCGLKGRAHGELVRSIAKDKDATAADAEAACTAAKAAALAAPARTTGKPAVTGNAKVKAPRPDKGPSAKSPHAATDDTDAATTDTSDTSDASSSDGGSAPAPKAPPGQAKKTKP